jgi:hypothetical protein
MISELSVVVISVSVILLCWAVVRINQKIDETIRNPNNINLLDEWDRPVDRHEVRPDETASRSSS